MNIKRRFSRMRYIFELGFRTHLKAVKLRHPVSQFACFCMLTTVTDADSEPTAIKAMSRLLSKWPEIYRQLLSVRDSVFFGAIANGRDRFCHLPSESASSVVPATVINTFRYSTSVTANSRQAPAFTITRRHFSPFFDIILLQLGRFCSGGIRLLAMQETGGQLLAKKQGSRAPLSVTFGGACA